MRQSFYFLMKGDIFMFGFLIALISGALISIQGVFRADPYFLPALCTAPVHGHRRGSGCLHHLDRHTQYG